MSRSIHDVALQLAQQGISSESIRETMRVLAEDAADKAIAWAEAYDRRERLRDREDFADEYMTEARRERERGCP